jgi:dihydroneopterin aldolase
VTDIVSISDLRVSTVIGVYDWERETEQALAFSVDMAADAARAASRDDIGDALDYSAVARTVKDVAQRLIADYGLTWVRVRVVKPITGEGYTAAVTVERGAHPAKLV